MDKNNIKLIVLDMDGTLLNTNMEITSDTKNAIFAAKKCGVHIVLCTGRPLTGVAKYAKELKLDRHDAIVVLNGGIVYHGDLSAELFVSTISSKCLIQIYEYAKQHSYHMHFFDNEKMYTVDANPAKETLYESELTSCPLIKITRTDLASSQGIAKISLFADKSVFDAEESVIRQSFPDFLIVRSKPRYIEIMNKDAGKGQALSYLSTLNNVEKSEIFSCGDEDNDLSLLQASGIKVAMKNATKKIKTAADFITDDNDHDGVAKAIRHFIL